MCSVKAMDKKIKVMMECIAQYYKATMNISGISVILKEESMKWSIKPFFQTDLKSSAVLNLHDCLSVFSWILLLF
jgi:ribosome recycling factor